MDYFSEYDKTDPLSIEAYAQKLIGKTFADVCNEDDMSQSMVVRETANYEASHEDKRRKGGLGELIEERFFHYKANGDSGPDFAEAGVELKVTPYPVSDIESKRIKICELPAALGELSATFKFGFENTGIMKDGIIYTAAATPLYDGEQITLGDILETGAVEEKFFIPEDRLYYTNPTITHSDESNGKLEKTQRQTWQYIKGAKKLPRKAKNGHEYLFTEGAVPMIDSYDKPARTMLTSEGGFSRTTHIVKDRQTGRIRLLTPAETERIQGFPTDHTKLCLRDGVITEMPTNKRRFMMGNALVVNLIEMMEKTLSDIFEEEAE